MWPRSLYYVWKSFESLSDDRESIARFQETRLQSTLAKAEKLPFYRDRIPSEKDRVFDSISEMPVLDSNSFRSWSGEMRELLESNSDLSRRTSGTTGGSTEVRFTEQAHDWLSAVYVRTLYLQGYRPGKSMVQFYENMSDQRSWIGKLMMPKSYIEPETSLQKQAEILEERSPEVLQYYPHMLLGLAKLAEEEDYEIDVDLVITYGENVTPAVREYIGQVFNAEVRDQYATTEFGVVAWQCPEGGYHLAEDSVYPEIIGGAGEEVSEGEVGRLILTGLVNDATPLIRYEIGDLVKLSEKSCSCKTSFRRVEKIVGRKENVFLNSEGEPVFPNQVIDLIAGEEDLLFYQLTAGEDSYKLKYVPNSGFKQKSLENVKQNLQEELSIEPVELEQVDEIPERGGKISVIQNKQPDSEYGKLFQNRNRSSS